MHIKLLFILLISTTLAIAKSTKDELKKYDSKFAQFNSELSKISKSIFDESKTIQDLDKDLKSLGKELYQDKKIYAQEKRKLSVIQKERDEIVSKHKKVKDRAVDLSAKIISLSIVTNDGGMVTLNSIILDEALKTLSSKSKVELDKMNDVLKSRQEKIDDILKKMGVVEEKISNIENKKSDIENKKIEKGARLSSLKERKTAYKKKLDEVINHQKRLKKEIEKARKERERRELLSRKEYEKKKRLEAKEKKSKSSSSTRTKNWGSSYKKEQVKRYRGTKTISPIENYIVTRQFGNYKDPIYNIQLFNSSISLKPKSSNAKVRSIFNGKISLVKDDKILGKFVVIEHYNNLQTIYAHLDSFAPNIRTGKRVKKGAIIGRVKDELYFEVMDKNYHINPVQVIE
jgi:murein DD-endopeptidase MepM/ murein hydrolase activator NlpD